tara:strand:+ start:357 stop:530 length:174 start_codon:yes stop_codon:yes gene_type:complete
MNKISREEISSIIQEELIKIKNFKNQNLNENSAMTSLRLKEIIKEEIIMWESNRENI